MHLFFTLSYRSHCSCHHFLIYINFSVLFLFLPHLLQRIRSFHVNQTKTKLFTKLPYYNKRTDDRFSLPRPSPYNIMDTVFPVLAIFLRFLFYAFLIIILEVNPVFLLNNFLYSFTLFFGTLIVASLWMFLTAFLPTLSIFFDSMVMVFNFL